MYNAYIYNEHNFFHFFSFSSRNLNLFSYNREKITSTATGGENHIYIRAISSPTKMHRQKVTATEIRHAFTNNLQLLGYKNTTRDSQTSSTSSSTFRRQRSQPFGPDMFQEANSHGLNALVYFLLTRLNADHYKELFDACWPVYDANQMREFRKLVLIELRSFENAGHIPRGLSQTNLLSSPQGARADRLMWHLSTYVLRAVIARDHDSSAATAMSLLPQVSPDTASASAPAQKTHLRKIIRATEAQGTYRETKFRDQASRAASTQRRMIQQAEALTRDLRSSEAQKAALAESLRSLEHSATPHAKSDDNDSSTSKPLLQEMMRGWDTTALQLDTEVKEGWERLQPMLTARDGATLTFDIVESADNVDKADNGGRSRRIEVGKEHAEEGRGTRRDVVEMLDESTRRLNVLSAEFLGYSVPAAAEGITDVRDKKRRTVSAAVPLRNLGDMELLHGLTSSYTSYLDESKELLARLAELTPGVQSSLIGLATQLHDEEIVEEKDTRLSYSSIASSSSSSSSSIATAADAGEEPAEEEIVPEAEHDVEEKVERADKIEEKEQDDTSDISTRIAPVPDTYDLSAIRDQLSSLRNRVEPISNSNATNVKTPLKKQQTSSTTDTTTTDTTAVVGMATPTEVQREIAPETTSVRDKEGSEAQEKILAAMKKKRRVSFSPDTEDITRTTRVPSRAKRRLKEERKNVGASSPKLSVRERDGRGTSARTKMSVSKHKIEASRASRSSRSSRSSRHGGQGSGESGECGESGGSSISDGSVASSPTRKKIKMDLLRRKKLQQKVRMAVKSTPVTHQTANPLRGELIKLISALHRHGVITSETRGSLKDELIGARTMTQLRALHEKISFDVGNQVAPVSSASSLKGDLPIPDIHELIDRERGSQSKKQ